MLPHVLDGHLYLSRYSLIHQIKQFFGRHCGIPQVELNPIQAVAHVAY
jgi:hypothetical protein